MLCGVDDHWAVGIEQAKFSRRTGRLPTCLQGAERISSADGSLRICRRSHHVIRSMRLMPLSSGDGFGVLTASTPFASPQVVSRCFTSFRVVKFSVSAGHPLFVAGSIPGSSTRRNLAKAVRQCAMTSGSRRAFRATRNSLERLAGVRCRGHVLCFRRRRLFDDFGFRREVVVGQSSAVVGPLADSGHGGVSKPALGDQGWAASIILRCAATPRPLARLHGRRLRRHGHPSATGEHRSAALGRCRHALAEVGGRL